jgi:hypothetical protein
MTGPTPWAPPMKHFGRKSHKVHVQRHFMMGKGWYAWCEVHGRLGKVMWRNEATAIVAAKDHVGKVPTDVA